MNNIGTTIINRLTVFEFLTECNNEQLKEIEEMIQEVRQMRNTNDEG